MASRGGGRGGYRGGRSRGNQRRRPPPKVQQGNSLQALYSSPFRRKLCYFSGQLAAILILYCLCSCLSCLFPESEELGTRELDLGEKKYYIDIKANDQGKFIKIVEVGWARKAWQLAQSRTRFCLCVSMYNVMFTYTRVFYIISYILTRVSAYLVCMCGT